MSATPIPPHVIQTVFSYILPPSLPLPPHLLSKRLAERHHYLSISPTDPTSYLCWPSSDASQVAEALERGISDTLAPEPDHEVRYTTPDEETVLAHVRPDAHSPLQVVFAWDSDTATWRYHDARMLPFPNASIPSLGAAPRTTSGLGWPPIIDQPPHKSRSASPNADDYWAGYDSAGSSPDTSALPPSIPAEEDDKAEAAYWASYSAVHGSGDSTIPSPKLEQRHVAQHQRMPEPRGPETTFDPFVAQLHLRLQQQNGAPNSPLSSPLHHSHAANIAISNETVSEPVESGYSKVAQHDYGFLKDDSKMVGTNVPDQVCEKDINIQTKVRSQRDDREDGLREAIKGIYRLWKAQSGSEDAGTFIDIVKDTLEI